MILHIIAPPGAGKTSLAAAMGISCMYGEKAAEAIQKSANLIDAMNASGFNIPSPRQLDHLVYTYMFNIKAISPDFGTCKSWNLDATRLGFRTEDFEPQFVYPGSTLIIDEFQTVWNARDWTEFPPNVSRWYEQHRKLMLDIIIISQRNGIVDKNVRELCAVTLVRDMKIKYNAYNEISQVIWTLENWDCYRDYDEHNRGTISKFEYNGNIFDCYETNAGFERFFDGVTDNTDFLPMPHVDVELSPEGIAEYVKKNPIKMKKKEQK